jgi:hypothetical protein
MTCLDVSRNSHTPQQPGCQQQLPDSASKTAFLDLPEHILAQLVVEAASPLHICKAFTFLSGDPYFRVRRDLRRRYKGLFPAAAAAEDGLWHAARLQLGIDCSKCQSATQRSHYLPYFTAQLGIFIEQAARTGQMKHLVFGLQLARQAGVKRLPVTQSMITAGRAAAAQGREDICRLLKELGMTCDLHAPALEPWYVTVLIGQRPPAYVACLRPHTYDESVTCRPAISLLLLVLQGAWQLGTGRATAEGHAAAGGRQHLCNRSCARCQARALGGGLSHAAQL